MGKKKEKKSLESVSPDGQGGLARALGSTDWHTREAGLQSIATWLSKRKDLITYNDTLRMWKAIFYCYWHSDLVPVQTALAERLSEIMLQLPEHVGELYFKSFVGTMRREWFGIDHLRLDKYMMLVRKFYTQHLRFLQGTGWNAQKLQMYSKFWVSEVFLPKDTTPAAGFAYHVADIVIPQLRALLEEGGPALEDSTMKLILAPYCKALQSTSDAALMRRFREGLFTPLIDEIKKGSGSKIAKKMNVEALATFLFDLGAKEETRAANREALYSISQDLEKAAKHRSSKKNKTLDEKPDAAANKKADEPMAEKKAEKGKKKRKAIEAEPVVVLPAAAMNGSGGSHEKVKKKQKKQKTPAQEPEKSTKHESSTGKKHALGTTNGHHANHDDAAVHRKAQKSVERVLAAAGSNASGQKKNVRFSLKNNLVMQIGGPVPAAEIRTPPTAQPKGPALKKTGDGIPGRLQKKFTAKLELAGSTPGVTTRGGAQRQNNKKGSGKKQRGGKNGTPSSLPRPKAAQFF